MCKNGVIITTLNVAKHKTKMAHFSRFQTLVYLKTLRIIVVVKIEDKEIIDYNTALVFNLYISKQNV